MKEKYIDEEYGYWFDFGIDTKTGECDIIDSSNRLGLGTRDPWELIAEHNRVQRRLVETAQAFSKANPEEFTKFWYNK